MKGALCCVLAWAFVVWVLLMSAPSPHRHGFRVIFLLLVVGVML